MTTLEDTLARLVRQAVREELTALLPELRDALREPTPGKRAYSIRDAAEELGIGRNAVYALVQSGELRSVRLGRRYIILADALRAYLDRSR